MRTAAWLRPAPLALFLALIAAPSTAQDKAACAHKVHQYLSVGSAAVSAGGAAAPGLYIVGQSNVAASAGSEAKEDQLKQIGNFLRKAWRGLSEAEIKTKSLRLQTGLAKVNARNLFAGGVTLVFLVDIIATWRNSGSSEALGEIPIRAYFCGEDDLKPQKPSLVVVDGYLE